MIKLLKQFAKKCNLPADFSVLRDLVRKRVERGSTVVLNDKGSVQVSPLLDAEPQFVAILTQTSRIGDLVILSHAMVLINDLIAGTNYQKNLVNFKRKHCRGTEESDLGQVEYKYWLNFKSRIADKIITRRGEYFKLDRSN